MSYTYIPEEKYTLRTENTNNTICFYGNGHNQTPMMEIRENGFWVRGVKVEQDDKEAKSVYDAFKAFLMWSELNRR